MSGVLTRVPYSYSLSYDTTQTNQTALELFLGGLNKATAVVIKESLACNSNNNKRMLRNQQQQRQPPSQQQQRLEMFQANSIPIESQRESHTHSQIQRNRRIIECGDDYRVQSRFQDISYHGKVFESLETMIFFC